MEKIGILLPSDPRISPEWGVKKVATEIGKAILKSKKYKLAYIFINNKNSYISEDNIEYIWIKSVWRSPLDILLFGYRLNKINLDLIIDNMGIANLYWNISKTTKIMQICHGVAWEWLKNIVEKNIFKKIIYWLYYLFIHVVWKFTYKKADLIIALSKYWKKWIMNYYNTSANKINIIFNWADWIKYNSKYDNDWVKILFISWDHNRKRVDILEYMAKQLEKQNNNVQFNIIWAPYHSKQQNIKYLWKLSREETYKNMRESDIIFLPSNFEWQPLVVLEAMNFGCIPLVSKKCNLDMLEWTSLEQFISPTNDASFYTKKIEYLLTHPDKIQAMKEQARQLVSTYTRKNQAKLYLEAIDKLLK